MRYTDEHNEYVMQRTYSAVVGMVNHFMGYDSDGDKARAIKYGAVGGDITVFIPAQNCWPWMREKIEYQFKWCLKTSINTPGVGYKIELNGDKIRSRFSIPGLK